MKRYAVVAVGLIGLLASPLFAQGQAPSNVDAIRQYYNAVKNNILQAADKMSDADYAFKPTPEERTFGGWVAHVADAQTGGCSRALGTPKTPSAGSKTTKADLVAALKESFDTCDAAYAALTDANASEPVQSFRGQLPASRPSQATSCTIMSATAPWPSICASRASFRPPANACARPASLDSLFWAERLLSVGHSTGVPSAPLLRAGVVACCARQTCLATVAIRLE